MARRWLSGGLLLAGACGLALACDRGRDAGDAPCQAGTGRYCTCADGAEGTQLCIGDTGEWAACDCSGEATGGTDGLGSGGSGQTGGDDGSGGEVGVGGTVGLGGDTNLRGTGGLDAVGTGGTTVDTGGTGGDGTGGRALSGGSGGTAGAAGGAACPAGTELCPCGPNGTCDPGLVCGSGLCVDIGSGGSAGAPGAGGSSGSPGSGGADGGQAGAVTGSGGGGGVAGAAPGTGGAGGCADTLCGAECVDLLTSADHCGECNAVCLAPQTCSQGSCECTEGLTFCADDCVDTTSDDDHCGGCDDPCTGGQFCDLGDCVCPEGEDWCSDICTDTDFDVTHCGDCDVACGGNDLCLTGRCRTGDHDLSLYHRTDPGGGQHLSPRFEICNATDTAVPLTELTLRYWYTADGTSSDPCNWDGAPAGCQAAEIWAGEDFTTAAIQAVNPARNQADYVLVLTFTSGEIAPYDCSDQILIGIHGNWTNYDEGNDWSYDGATTLTLNDHITVYRSNNLTWGTEPG